MGHAFQTYPPFRAEDLKTEPRAGRRQRTQIARHAFLHAEKDRRRIVAIDVDRAPETLAINVIDRTTEINHAVDRMNAHWRQSAAGCFFAVSPPLRRLQHQCIRERHRRLNMHEDAQPARPDALAKLCHFRMKTAVIAETERNTGFARRINGSFGIALVKSEWLLAKDVLSSLCRGDHLPGMHGMRCAKHNGLNSRILQKGVEVFRKTKLVSVRECRHLR